MFNLVPFSQSFLIVLFLTITNISQLNAHGRLMNPPSRSSVWRFKEFSSYNPPPNYNDMELSCGGQHQPTNPGDLCGLCGDPISQSKPRDNEFRGFYYKGIITGKYTSGQVKVHAN
jgi:hypothetical protein